MTRKAGFPEKKEQKSLRLTFVYIYIYISIQVGRSEKRRCRPRDEIISPKNVQAFLPVNIGILMYQRCITEACWHYVNLVFFNDFYGRQKYGSCQLKPKSDSNIFYGWAVRFFRHQIWITSLWRWVSAAALPWGPLRARSVCARVSSITSCAPWSLTSRSTTILTRRT